MDYYYLDLVGNAIGPVPEQGLAALRAAGVIAGDTLVVPVGSETWTTYASITTPPPPAPRYLPQVAILPTAKPAASLRQGSRILAMASAAIVLTACTLAIGVWYGWNRSKGKIVQPSPNEITGSVVGATQTAEPQRVDLAGANDNAKPAQKSSDAGLTVAPLLPAPEHMSSAMKMPPKNAPLAETIPPAVTVSSRNEGKNEGTARIEEPPNQFPLAEWYEFGFRQGQDVLKVFSTFGDSPSADRSQVMQLIRNMGLDAKDIPKEGMELCFNGYRDAIERRTATQTVASNQKKSVLPAKLRGYHSFPEDEHLNLTASSAAINHVLSCTVFIVTSIESRSGELLGVGEGSGLFVAPGLIITNRHVIEKARRGIIRMPDKSKTDAEMVAVSEKYDLALLRISKVDHPVIKFGDSTRAQVGDIAIAVGFPEAFALAEKQEGDVVDNFLKLNPTTTFGHLSNTDFDYRGNPCLQLDLTINHGNSGGPLVDAAGRLLGVNTFGLGGEKLGVDRLNFAIKSAVVIDFIQGVCPGTPLQIED